MNVSRKHLKIQGKVQGVGFRQNTQALAQKLGLRGWVKNTQAGDVEVIVEGENSKVSLFIEWCHEGPKHAVVSSVEILHSQQADGYQFSDFTINKTS